jgi:hypothetical protein
MSSFLNGYRFFLEAINQFGSMPKFAKVLDNGERSEGRRWGDGEDATRRQ